MTSNSAAWLTAPKTKPLNVADAPMPTPQANEVVIRNRAIAINPVDWKMQAFDFLIDTYPAVLGCDVSGEIAAVGSNVEGLAPGDRVMALLDAVGIQRPSNGAFQLYCATNANIVCKIPPGTTHADAAVIPLGLSTAAVALFQTDTLALPHPQRHPVATNKTLLIWGGSSSVGGSAIQLARASGLTVATTASSANRAHCEALGAAHVFDHANPNVVADIVAALRGADLAGAFDAISTPDTIRACAAVVAQLDGTKFVATTAAPRTAMPDDLPADLRTSHAFGLSLAYNEVGGAVWGSWAPAALESGALKCMPPPLVVGRGLDKLQEACDRMREGVSARKLVVEVP